MKSAFKNLKKADWIIIFAVLIILIALIIPAAGIKKYISKSPILEERDIYFTVFLRGVTVTDIKSPFQIGEDTFITIRNVPYTKLKIKDVRCDRRKKLLETSIKGDYKLVDDVTMPFMYDFEITIQDRAKITDDGAVVGGNKIKIGIPVVLEGKNYKLNGIVSNVQFYEGESQYQNKEENQVNSENNPSGNETSGESK